VESMMKVPAAEFQRNAGEYRRDREVLGFEDFTDADLAALEAARAPEATKEFDGELKPE
jgi:hypothetical protein